MFGIEYSKEVSKASQCCSIHVGAVIMEGKNVISHGYNKTPHNIVSCFEYAKTQGWLLEDGSLDPAKRHLHSAWSAKNEVHAEIVAIMEVGRLGRSVVGATLYVTHSPCPDCCKAIAQSGIAAVVYGTLYDRSPADWADILINAGVVVEKYEKS